MKPAEKAKKGAEARALKFQQAWDLAKEGKIEEVDPELRLCHLKSLMVVRSFFHGQLENLEVLENEWIFGPPGCGKSRSVRERFPGAYIKNGTKWWDGYQNEEVVIMDDFELDFGKCFGHLIKIWSDHYPFKAEVKGFFLD